MSKLIKLKRTIARRIPGRDLVVEIALDGIRIRRYGKRLRSHVTWEQLAETFPPPASSRGEAFSRPAPRGWVPSRGDEVWIDVRASRRGKRGTVTSTIDACGGPIIGVRLPGRTKSEQFALRELRPAG